MWRKINNKMLKKRQQKSSMRLYDRVVVRKWVKNKSHHHVHEFRTFSKRPTWCELTITPIYRTLTESGNHLVFGNNPQTLITRVVKMLYPWNMEHLGYNIWCNHYVRNSNVSTKKRYRSIQFMHVGVELLDQHERTGDRDVTQWLPTPIMNDNG